MIQITGYQITEQLYESPNSQIYRGRRVSDQQAVILKLLSGDYPTRQQLTSYRQEYALTRSLTSDRVIKMYELLHYQNSLVMVVEDFGGDSLTKLRLAGQLNIVSFLRLALWITQALGAVHRALIVHKDINPANIIYNQQTDEVKLIDFGIATQLSRSQTSFRNPNQLEGTLAYISPEQTGRMNRVVDFRTDFYALGVTLYELLTGQLPFMERDSLALVHAHIAKPITPPHTINNDIPPLLSALIMKLLAKNAEERYQSAYGLQVDLEACLTDWEKHQAITPFVLAQADQHGQFQLPERLYGRTEQVTLLVEAFDRVSQGGTELLLVAGYSGVGKSALVQEMYRPITEKAGHFIQGKFDQFQRNVPYVALRQAFNQWVAYLLTEPERVLAIWRNRILEVVGKNGQVLLEVIPQLERLIGEQPDVPTLGPSETQNQFNHLFQQFLRVIAQAEHPLVLFIDDLQWADNATLQLLQTLLSDDESHHFLVLGAYRDNEVDEAHPLQLTLSELTKAGAKVSTISLGNLSIFDLLTLIQDTLHGSVEEVEALTTLVYQKTEGNAFFARQFLQNLYEQAFINFDFITNRWQWDVTEIDRQDLSDNVVDLLISKIQKLAFETQQALMVTACIGNHFDLKTLALVQGKSAVITLEQLWVSIKEGLIVPLNEAWQTMKLVRDESLAAEVWLGFVHDRVQQAVYALVSETQRIEWHAQIGRIMLVNHSTEDETLFDIVDHLNEGRTVITMVTEQLELAELNLQAGQRAKQATAYQAAQRYFIAGLSLLPESAWQSRYTLIFELHKAHGETELLLGQPDKADQILDIAYRNANSDIDRAMLDMIKIKQLSSQAQYPEAVLVATKTLKRFGINIPRPDEAELIQRETEQELNLYQTNMQARTIESLADLPMMTNERLLLCSQVISLVIGPVTLGTPQLLPLYTCKLINLTIEHGLSTYLPVVCVFHGVVEGAILHNYDGAYRFSALGLALHENCFKDETVSGKVYHMYAFYSVLHKHSQVGLEYQRKTYQAAIASGDLLYAGYGLTGIVRFLMPFDINQGISEAQIALNFVKRTQDSAMILFTNVARGFFYALQGQTYGKDRLDFDEFSTQQYIDTFGEAAPTLITYLKQYQIILFNLFGFHQQALPLVYEREHWILIAGYININFGVYYRQFSGLTVAALYDQASSDKQAEYLEILDDCLNGLQELATQCAVNFEHSYLILKAEKARINNQFVEAMQSYELAIELAREHQFTLNEALANELAAKLYLAQGLKLAATVYFTEAYYAYHRWGATSKADDLLAHYPNFIKLPQSGVTASATLTTRRKTKPHQSTNLSTNLDIVSVVKASQTIARELELEKLLRQMMQVVIENAGAERGGVLLYRDQAWWLEAVVEPDGETLLQGIPLAKVDGHGTTPLISRSIVDYAVRVAQPLVVDDACQDPRFSRSRYIKQFQPKSVLAMPLFNQGKLIGLLYLENNQTKGAFTPQRLELLKLLSTQAANSISNAQAIVLREEALLNQQRFQAQKDAIYTTTHLLNIAADLADLLQSVADGLVKSIPADAVVVILFDIETSKITHYIKGGDSKNFVEVLTFAELNDGLTGWVIREKRPALSGKGQPDPRESKQVQVRRQNNKVGSIMVVPIQSKDTLLGTMTALNPIDGRDFTPQDIELMVAMGNQVATGLQTITLFNQLQTNEKKYRTIFEESRDVIFITKVDGTVIDISPACETMFGYRRAEAMSLNARDLYFDPSDRDRFIQQMTTQGTVKDYELQLKRKDGHPFLALMSATLWENDAGQVTDFQGIVRDITTQKQAEQERLRLTAIERELSLAHEMQQSLLPASQPVWQDVEVICYSMPAKDVGGDFYQYHRFYDPQANKENQARHQKYAFVVGDVSGKGVSAALLMATSLSQLDAALLLDLTPAERLAHLDRGILPYTKPRRQNCAMCYVELQSSLLHIINAGCIPPYIKRANGTVEHPEIGGFALGQGLGMAIGYQQHTIELSPGEIIILTSDGVVEANNDMGDMLGFEQLTQIVEDGPITSAVDMLKHLQENLFHFIGTAKQHDDMTIVVVKI